MENTQAGDQGVGIGGNKIQASKIKSKTTMKRKSSKKRSKVWAHYKQFQDDAGVVERAKCNYCGKELMCHPTRNGTSSLNAHLKSCMKNPNNQDTCQGLLNLKPNEGNVGMGALTSWKFDQDEIRTALARMLIIDELPFKCVEGEGFKEFVSKACPRFHIPSRWTLSRDCYELYVNQRAKVKSFMKTNCERVCITTDTWTSLQRINYMCITAHFIDNEWNLHKKIISFVLVSSHRGDYLGKALENCLLDWGLKNVFTITVDNASSNDTAIAFLKKKLLNWGSGVAGCKYLHMRCIEHIVNLVVSDGLKEINPSVKRVRDAVRYIRNSPARLKRFKECVDLEGIESKKSLCLDVATRWNSTYLMLSTAEKFERAFDRYDEQDSSFKADLGEDGVPSHVDWACVRKYADLLKHFYKLTVRISGSSYVTSDSFLSEISDLCCILNDWKESMDLDTKNLGESMRKKFDKYWGDAGKMNKIIFWADVFDPRDKLEYMEYTISQMYGKANGDVVFQSVKKELFELFNEYKKKYQSRSEAAYDISNKSCSNGIVDCEMDGEQGSLSKARFKKQKKESGLAGSKKNELEIYLSEDIIEGEKKLDVLKWWKINSERLPILSRMARDILAVPISTVASESAFSTGGRVLDVFRSSLTPKVVEALICGQDWLRSSRHPICVEEQIEELENFEKDLQNVGIGGAGGATEAGAVRAGATSTINL